MKRGIMMRRRHWLREIRLIDYIHYFLSITFVHSLFLCLFILYISGLDSCQSCACNDSVFECVGVFSTLFFPFTIRFTWNIVVVH